MQGRLGVNPDADLCVAAGEVMDATQFADSDLAEELPAPGHYAATISTARLRSSQGGNSMVHVVYALEGVAAAYDRVSEYFVLEGASARGLALSRRRLVELFRACGLAPQPGEEIAPGRLAGARLRVKVEHEQWRGELHLRVVGHQPPADGPVPF
jgi:hypothetical protein